jgi:hypothetical protein
MCKRLPESVPRRSIPSSRPHGPCLTLNFVFSEWDYQSLDSAVPLAKPAYWADSNPVRRRGAGNEQISSFYALYLRADWGRPMLLRDN